MKKLEVDSVNLEFGDKRVLSDIYMCFESGRVTAVLGRNGSGKSCLLRIIYGSIKAGYSNVRFDGKTVTAPYKHPEMIRYMPQDSFIPGSLALPSVFKLYGLDYDPICSVFPEFGEEPRKHFRNYSFGQKRLAETWIILKSSSDFVMLDEPFSYIMPVHVDKLKEAIIEEKSKKGIIITDHLYREILDIADDLYLIADGGSRKMKDPRELKTYGYLA
jgi:ABC-type multidrug transport system ATPase subunit